MARAGVTTVDPGSAAEVRAALIETMHDLFLPEMGDPYSAEEHVAKAMQEMRDLARSGSAASC